ncbi:CBS domain-containing protein [Carboxylicivirga sp. A043]|uniref:CBS domain-containing protein n=1 Tax=Carboxylicivirga litoralis TaxID=2816963 RepID=UPI0021CB1AD1|nr:CBS domain-containing protein [Carboxylicivirga sp. A043]MCU4154901.1 CBS domain-containing protein [Carboxylicivirga sp. A043]
MLARELISEVVPSLKTSDTGLDALNWMEVFRVSHLPIVNNRAFLGVISDVDIYDLNKAEEALGNHSLSYTRPYVYAHQHIFDVIEVASRLKLTIVPVLDKNEEYLGLITQSDLLHTFADLIAAHASGGIIELELLPNDYSLAEISRIVEDADAKILSLYVSQPHNSEKLCIAIKLNRVDVRPVLNAFERYDYSVKTTYVGDDSYDDTVKKNYDALMRYLNM